MILMHNKNFNYVNNLLKGSDYRLVHSSPVRQKLRDGLFLEILDSFQGQPIRVFQIGAIESLENMFRVGSGWSDLFWGDYIKKHGGSLLIVDLDFNHIANSMFIANQLNHNTRFHYGDAIEAIKEGFDIYYLDGADISYAPDAYVQTLNQFKKIEHTKSIVVVDDMPSKGVELKKYIESVATEKQWIVQEYGYGSGMMTIDMRQK